MIRWTHFVNTKKTDAEKFKNENINVFTRTEFEKSSDTQISANQSFLAQYGLFSYPGDFAHKTATHNSSLKFDVDDEFSAKNDTF